MDAARPERGRVLGHARTETAAGRTLGRRRHGPLFQRLCAGAGDVLCRETDSRCAGSARYAQRRTPAMNARPSEAVAVAPSTTGLAGWPGLCLVIALYLVAVA